MVSGAYYNEFDPKAAAWLRELIKQGHIADGEVDERDLWDVAPDDIRGFRQVHLCAGIGVWSYTLRRAGWEDSRECWTSSFPCQPFSAAGKGAGFADERHLWPAGFHLIEQCRPAIVFGEQVASKDAEPWIDLVQDDLEAVGYCVGAVPFPSAGVGAPHIRDRLYWVADTAEQRRFARIWQPGATGRIEVDRPEVAGRGEAHIVADSDVTRSQGRLAEQQRSTECVAGPGSMAGSLADANGGHPGAERQQRSGEQRQQPEDGGIGVVADTAEQGRIARGRPTRSSDGRDETRVESGRLRDAGDPGPTNGLWRDADWLLCRDGKWRPVEPGTFPLAHGAPARVGRLRGYGNAINAEAAVAWIEAYLDAEADQRDFRLTGIFA